jgi:putative oxidoreductase
MEGAGVLSPRPLRDLLVARPAHGPRAVAAFIARLAGGGLFVAFGVGKFTSHATEVASFQDYGLHAPDVFVYAIGAVEVVGGLLLVLGFLTRPAAFVLAGDMSSRSCSRASRWGRSSASPSRRRSSSSASTWLWTGPGVLALDRSLRAP